MCFPAPFPVLPNLTRLEMTSSGLDAVPPAVLSSMPKLRVLHLEDRAIEALPDELDDFADKLKARNKRVEVAFK